MKASVFLFTVLSLFVSTSYAGTVTIDWSTIECDDPLEEGEVCYGKIMTLMGEDLAFPTADTLLFDDEYTWGNCTLANSTVVGTEFDSTPEGEKPVKGGRYFASDNSCTHRYKVIFRKKKFGKPAKKTSCSGTEIDTELGNDGKKCMKICKNVLTGCGAFQISGRGQARTCTFFEASDAELGETNVKRTKCRLAVIPKNVILGE